MIGGSGDLSAQESDEAIVRRIQVCAGNNHSHEARIAFEQLYTRHRHRILHLILFFLNHPKVPEVAEDLTENTFIKAFYALVINQAPVSFTEGGKVQAWLNRIAYHEVLQYEKQRKRYISLDALKEGRGESSIEETIGTEVSPFTEDVERRIAIEEAKSKLLPRDRQIIELSFEQDMAIHEVAKILNIDVRAARMARLRAGERFAKVYEGPLSSTQGQQNDSSGV